MLLSVYEINAKCGQDIKTARFTHIDIYSATSCKLNLVFDVSTYFRGFGDGSDDGGVIGDKYGSGWRRAYYF